MGSSDITSLALICLALLAILHSSHAQNSQQDYLDTHNSARSAVGVGPMTWDDEVAAFAQNYANQRAGDCALMHSGGKYGENIAEGSGDFTGAAAVLRWACGWERNPITIMARIRALVGSVGTTLRWSGVTRFGLGALGFSATVDGGSLLVTTIHRATTMGKNPTRGIILLQK